jgi:hypothetical protein
MFDVQHGRFAQTEWSSRFVYARVAVLANCAHMPGLPADERFLCPDPHRRRNTQAFLWGKTSPIHGLPHSADPRIRDFAMRVIRAHPLGYARLVLSDFAHYFEPGHRVGFNDYNPAPWEFPEHPATGRYPGYRGPIRPGSAHRKSSIDPNQYVSRMVSRPHTNARVSRLLRLYQRFAYTSGQLLAACVVLVLFALVRRGGDRRLRLDAALLAAAALMALLVSSAASQFSYRYGLTAVVLLPPAAALAGAALLRPRTA